MRLIIHAVIRWKRSGASGGGGRGREKKRRKRRARFPDCLPGQARGALPRRGIAKGASLVIAIPAYRFASVFYGRSQRIVKRPEDYARRLCVKRGLTFRSDLARVFFFRQKASKVKGGDLASPQELSSELRP